MYNNQALSGLTGVSSIYDDIIVHGKNEEEHNRNLELLLQRIQAKGLTINVDKCHLNMPQIEFMGHIIIGTRNRSSREQSYRYPWNEANANRFGSKEFYGIGKFHGPIHT